jgi:hypothetical protein
VAFRAIGKSQEKILNCLLFQFIQLLVTKISFSSSCLKDRQITSASIAVCVAARRAAQRDRDATRHEDIHTAPSADHLLLVPFKLCRCNWCLFSHRLRCQGGWSDLRYGRRAQRCGRSTGGGGWRTTVSGWQARAHSAVQPVVELRPNCRCRWNSAVLHAWRGLRPCSGSALDPILFAGVARILAAALRLL